MVRTMTGPEGALELAHADDAWTLRCAVREELLDWLGTHHPHALPKIPTSTVPPLP